MARPVGPRVQSKLKRHLQRPSMSTPQIPHIRHRASTGNLHAQTASFFDTPADPRSTQYVTYQPHFHSTPSMQGQLGMTSSVQVPKD